jgi:hypothetical protein
MLVVGRRPEMAGMGGNWFSDAVGTVANATVAIATAPIAIPYHAAEAIFTGSGGQQAIAAVGGAVPAAAAALQQATGMLKPGGAPAAPVTPASSSSNIPIYVAGGLALLFLGYALTRKPRSREAPAAAAAA